MRPRGERNNNPGNIRHGQPWRGLARVQQDANFCTFENSFWGIRALCRTLISYQERHNKKTVEEILFRWAPPVENDTWAYVAMVAEELGVDPREPLDIVNNVDRLVNLAKAIIHHENGRCIYNDAEIHEAAAAAIEKPKGTTA